MQVSTNEAELVGLVDTLVDQARWAPFRAQLFPTDLCSHRCTFCVSAGYRARAELPLEMLQLAVRDLQLAGVRNLEFCGGGEPLQHPGITELLYDAHQLGLTLFLTTNASRITPLLIDAIAATCTRVKVSLDACDADAYARIHRVRPAIYERVIEAVRCLADAARAGDATLEHVELSCVLDEPPHPEPGELLSLAKALGVTHLTVTTSTLRSRTDEEERLLARLPACDPEITIRRVVSGRDELIADCDLPCPLVLAEICITAEGRVFPTCHHVSFPEHSLAQVGSNGTHSSVASVMTDATVGYRLMRYAFGITDKMDKLVGSGANLQFVRALKRTRHLDLLTSPQL